MKRVVFVIIMGLAFPGLAWSTVAVNEYGKTLWQAQKAKAKKCDDAWFGHDGQGQRFLEECRLEK
jgi:hypothetical protein